MIYRWRRDNRRNRRIGEAIYAPNFSLSLSPFPHRNTPSFYDKWASRDGGSCPKTDFESMTRYNEKQARGVLSTYVYDIASKVTYDLLRREIIPNQTVNFARENFQVSTTSGLRCISRLVSLQRHKRLHRLQMWRQRRSWRVNRQHWCN